MFNIEYEAPLIVKCNCCDDNATRLTRFVYNDDDAFAVYFMTFTDAHVEKTAYVVVSIGQWGEDSTPEMRRAFSLLITKKGNGPEVNMIDKAASPWKDKEDLGKMFDKEEALGHAWLKDALAITQQILTQDDAVIDYFS